MDKVSRIFCLIAAVTLATAACDENLLPDRVEVTPEQITLDALGATHQFSANVLDKNGGVVGSPPITWTTSNLNIVSVSATGLVTATGPGTASIRASTEGATGVASIQVDPTPAEVAPVSGDGQTTQVLFTLSSDPTVEVRDRLGNGLAGIPVSFSAVSGGGSVGMGSQVTGSDGRASTTWTLGSAVGNQEMEASAAGISTTFTATAYPAPSVQLSATELQFAASLGNADPLIRTISVENGGGGTLSGISVSEPTYSGVPPAPWLSAALDGAQGGATLTVVVSPADLPNGIYQATLSVTSPVASNGPQLLTVTVSVAEAPVLELSRTSVAFSATEGGAAPPAEEITVTNGGEHPLTGLTVGTPDYVGSPAASWLSATLDGTEAPATLTIQTTVLGLAPGSYEASLEVSSPVAENASETVVVTLTVLPAPRIALSDSLVSLTAFLGGADPAPAVVSVQNGGGQTLSGLTIAGITYSGAPPAPWLTATLGAGTAPTDLSLQATVAGLPEGSYSAAVEIDSPVAINSPRTVTVSLEVKDVPQISLQPGSVSLKVARGRTGAFFDLDVRNTGNGILSGLSYSISYDAGEPGSWLQDASLSSTTAPATLTMRPVASGLPVGTYHGSVRVSTSVPGVDPETASVRLDVVPSFDLDVWPLFTGCGGCHFVGAGGQVPNLSSLVSAYQSLVGGGGGTKYVTPGNPSASVSLLICSLQGGSCSIMPPAPAAPLTSQQIQLVKDWISGGALR